MQSLSLPGKPLDAWDSWRIRAALSKASPSYYFSPGFNPPAGRPCPFAFTIHDLIHLQVMEEWSIAKSIYYDVIIKPAMRRAEVVFTVSEYSKDRIAEWSGIDEKKIIVAGNGVGPNFTPKGEVWRLERPYFLYVGNQKSHKNVEGMIRAYARSGLNREFDLLLSGKISRSLSAIASSEGVAENVKSLGFIDEADLPSLYRGAFAVVMPSRYEGFGLPVVEAMACGTPVLSSERTSLPEIGGDAVRYFDPDDEESFVEGLRALRDDQVRADLRWRGLQRAKLFDWDCVAKRVKCAIEFDGSGVCNAV